MLERLDELYLFNEIVKFQYVEQIETAASMMEAAVLFLSCWGQNVDIFKSSMRVVQIGKSPCKGWYSIV